VTIWENRAQWTKHPRKLDAVVEAGGEKAQAFARKTLEETREAMKL